MIAVLHTTTGTECGLPDAIRREWGREAARVAIPELLDDPRHHALSIADELDDRAAETDPYSVALGEGERLAERYLTDEIRSAVQDYREGRTAYVVVRNLPVDEVDWSSVTPPSDGRRPKSKPWVSELSLLGLVEGSGLKCLGYVEEGKGALVQQVAPENGKEATNSGVGRIGFGFHSDNAIHPRQYRAEGIGLVGLMNDNNVETVLAPLDHILEALSPDTIEVLSQPLFVFPSPESFEYQRRYLSGRRAVLTRGDRGQMELSVSMYGVNVSANRIDGPMAYRALDALEAVLFPPVARSVIIGRGDVLLMSNTRALHARNAIPGRRWLQRVYFRESITDLREDVRTTDTRLSRRFRTETVLAAGV